MPSSSTGTSLIAGVDVSISGVCETTAGEVLCGNVPLRDIGDMGLESEEAMERGRVVERGGGEDVIAAFMCCGAST